jgi:hypothetical protein
MLKGELRVVANDQKRPRPGTFNSSSNRLPSPLIESVDS